MPETPQLASLWRNAGSTVRNSMFFKWIFNSITYVVAFKVNTGYHTYGYPSFFALISRYKTLFFFNFMSLIYQVFW